MSKEIIFVLAIVIIAITITITIILDRIRCKIKPSDLIHPDSVKYWHNLAQEQSKTQQLINNLKQRRMNIAVICRDNLDGDKHKGIKGNVYFMITRRTDIWDGLMFDAVEFAPQAIDNPIFDELLNITRSRIIKTEKEKLGPPPQKRKDGYYWVEYMGNWEVYYYANGRGWVSARLTHILDSYFEDICETPITRELFETIIGNEEMLKQRRALLDAIPEKGFADALNWIEKMKDIDKRIKSMEITVKDGKVQFVDKGCPLKDSDKETIEYNFLKLFDEVFDAIPQYQMLEGNVYYAVKWIEKAKENARILQIYEEAHKLVKHKINNV